MDLSIIIPMYNAEKYIQSLLEQILKQQTDIIYEIIVVDDKSTDNSVSILIPMVEKNKNLKLITAKQNGGTASARNIGLQHATGEWIQFVDSDDQIDGEYFKKICDVLVTTCANCLVYSTKTVYNDRIITNRPTKICDQRMLGYKNIVVNKIYKRDIVKKFRTDYMFEDVIWLVDMINQDNLNCQIIENLEYVINRKNENSKMANVNQDEWKKMALESIKISKGMNRYARAFVLETFVGTLFADLYLLKNRVYIAQKALRSNGKFITWVAKDGIRHCDKSDVTII